MAHPLAILHAHPAWRRWGLRAGLALAVAVAIAQVPWLLGGTDPHTVHLAQQLDQIQGEIRAQNLENARMADEVTALKTDVTAIESRARDELGMVYPGELVMRMERATPAPELPASRVHP